MRIAERGERKINTWSNNGREFCKINDRHQSTEPENSENS